MQEDKIKKTILLIEDDPLLVKMYKVKFEMEGFNVITAGDGEEGLQKALTEKVDFLILDVMMPKLSGFDLYKELKEKGKNNAPTIFISNLTQEENSKQALALGAKEYLIKADYTPGEVVEKIKSYLR
jgi:DNA-binding response OmpR family regulator